MKIHVKIRLYMYERGFKMKFINDKNAYIEPKLGVVATSEPNAAHAGLEILKKRW